MTNFVHHPNDQLRVPFVIGAACAFLPAEQVSRLEPTHTASQTGTRSKDSALYAFICACMEHEHHGTSWRPQGRSQIRRFRVRLFVVILLVTTDPSFDGDSPPSRALVLLWVMFLCSITISNTHCRNAIADWSMNLTISEARRQ
jgi:hypothetical protein